MYGDQCMRSVSDVYLTAIEEKTTDAAIYLFFSQIGGVIQVQWDRPESSRFITKV